MISYTKSGGCNFAYDNILSVCAKNIDELNGILDQDPSRTVYIYTNATICPKEDQLKSQRLNGLRIH